MTLENLLDVEPCPEREGIWLVTPYSDCAPEGPVGSYATQAAAWHHACWSPFHESNTLPKISPGNWFFEEGGKGYTSDPRFAATVPADSVDAHTRTRIDRAVVRFIRARVGDMSDLEAFFPEDVTEHTEAEAERLVNGVPAPAEYSWEDADALLDKTAEQAAERLAVYNAADDAQTKALEESLKPWTEPTASATESPAESLPDTPEGDTPEGPGMFAERAAELTEAERRAFDNFTDLADSAPTESARAYWRNLAHDVFAGVIPAE